MCVRDWWKIYNINIISAVGEIGPFIIQGNKHEGDVIRGVSFVLKKKKKKKIPGRSSTVRSTVKWNGRNIAVSRRKFYRKKYDDSVSLR